MMGIWKQQPKNTASVIWNRISKRGNGYRGIPTKCTRWTGPEMLEILSVQGKETQRNSLMSCHGPGLPMTRFDRAVKMEN